MSDPKCVVLPFTRPTSENKTTAGEAVDTVGKKYKVCGTDKGTVTISFHTAFPPATITWRGAAYVYKHTWVSQSRALYVPV